MRSAGRISWRRNDTSIRPRSRPGWRRASASEGDGAWRTSASFGSTPVGAAGRTWQLDVKRLRSAGPGVRPLRPAGLPVVGPVRQAHGIWVASGHSMLGVTLGPATGEALAAAVTGQAAEVLRPFDPGRFA